MSIDLPRRVKLLLITPEAIPGFFIGTRFLEVVESALPNDARLVNWNYNIHAHRFELVFESKEFEEIQGWQIIPQIIPSFQSYDKNKFELKEK